MILTPLHWLSLQAFPLPVEGTETMVLTDKPEVVNYMIALGEALEKASPAGKNSSV